MSGEAVEGEAQSARLPVRLIIGLWLLLSVPSLFKAYLVDDTFHLLMAEHVLEHPSSPYSGTIHWGNDPVLMQQGAHPPLFYYALAAVAGLLGWSEPAMHVLTALSALVALWCFARCASLMGLRDARVPLLLFAFFPAFVAGQNVMMEMPLLALLLAAFALLLRARRTGRLLDHAGVALLLAAAALIKYVALPLIVLHAAAIVVGRLWRALPALLVPMAVLVGWTLWNIHEIGTPHLFAKADAPHGGVPWFEYMACIGGLSFLAPLLYPWRKGRRLFIGVCATAPIALFGAGLAVAFRLIGEERIAPVLTGIFLINGACLTVLVPVAALRGIRPSLRALLEPRVLALGFAAALALFHLLFASFAAARYVLLSYPFLLLAAAPIIAQAPKRLVRIGIVLTVGLGLALGVSDFMHAGYYRRMAARIEPVSDARSFVVGHHGWQWYACERGLVPYGTETTALRDGDVLYRAGFTGPQPIALPAGARLDTLQALWEEPGPMTFFSVARVPRLYLSNLDLPVWTFSTSPIDTIHVLRVRRDREAAVQEIIRSIRASPHWLESVRAKAEERGIGLDSMLVIDGRWVLEQEERDASLE
jgi:4-amino-4-deoxy-L-arabinose transferase-like glycosyltransferase